MLFDQKDKERDLFLPQIPTFKDKTVHWLNTPQGLLLFRICYVSGRKRNISIYEIKQKVTWAE